MSPETAVLLKTEGLTKSFFHRKGKVRALDAVDVSAFKGKTVALVGESGCGKTTFAKTVMGLYRPESGTLLYRQIKIDGSEGGEGLSFLRRHVRIVFQDPYLSVDPRYTVFATLYEALTVLRRVNKKEGLDLCAQVLRSVDLSPSIMSRYPHQVSGGQLQRVCIARSLLGDPELIILDEPTSSLDVTTTTRLVALLRRLQKETGIGYMFISHNLKLVRHISDFIFVMYGGQIVEWGEMAEVYDNPSHPYTRLLLEAASYRLKNFPAVRRRPAEGCAFRARCPQAKESCRAVPAVKKLAENHWMRCTEGSRE